MRPSYLANAIVRLAVLTCLMFSLTGCATMYVDNTLRGVKVNTPAQTNQPQPVQLLFNFQTKGTSNKKAADFLQKTVEETVVASKLFSEVSSKPVANGALLSITINNVPITSEKEAAAKGFATGLTLGLAGNVVTDGYECTVGYAPATGSAQLSADSKHMIYTTVGAKGAPKNGIKAKNGTEAVTKMTREIVTSALDKLAQTPDFK